MDQKGLMAITRKFWETCGFKYAHLNDKGLNRVLRPGSRLEKFYTSEWLQYVDVKNKTLVDYGCGGGLVPRYLFENKSLGRAICLDIAERSLKIAAKTLRKFKDSTEFKLVPVELSQLNADILISLAVIQHFPSVEHLNQFLENANNSGVDQIVLQIRYGEETKSNNAYLKPDGNKGFACATNSEYIANKLTNYKITREGEVSERSRYQYLIYEISKLY
jgi:SAM-dependent methyltransferase